MKKIQRLMADSERLERRLQDCPVLNLMVQQLIENGSRESKQVRRFNAPLLRMFFKVTARLSGKIGYEWMRSVLGGEVFMNSQRSTGNSGGRVAGGC